MPECEDTVAPLQPLNGTGVIWFGEPWGLWLAGQGEREFDTRFQNLTGSPNWGELKAGGLHVNVSGGYQLPPGVFLVRGDRAWPGIPLNPVGEPCYLGRLTFLCSADERLLDSTIS